MMAWGGTIVRKAGLGELVEQDMIAVRIGPQMRMAAVASPSYLRADRRHGHRMIWPITSASISAYPRSGASTHGSLRRTDANSMSGLKAPLVFNGGRMLVTAAIDGFGIAYLTDDYVEQHVADGRLIRVLEDWSPPFPGFHLYYPSRRQLSPAFALVVDALRYRD